MTLEYLKEIDGATFYRHEYSGENIDVSVNTGLRTLDCVISSELIILDAKGNNLTSGAQIVDILAKNQIRILNLNYNELRHPEAILDALSKNTSLTELYLVRNGIQDIPEGENIPFLLSLDLSRNVIRDKGIQNILARCTGLTRLDIADIKLSDTGLAAISSTIRTNQNLKILNISQNSISRTIHHESPFYPLVSENSSLTHLDMQGIYLLEIDFRAITEGLRVNQTLKKLMLGSIFSFLRESEAKTELFEEFASVLALNNTLEVLTLSGMDIGDSQARSIFRALCENTSLQELQLEHNNIESTDFIVNAFKANKTLQRLDLGSNRFNEDGLMSILESLTENDSLTSLSLNNMNSMKNERRVKELAETLKGNYSLVYLDVYSSEHYENEGFNNWFTIEMSVVTERNRKNKSNQRFTKTKAIAIN